MVSNASLQNMYILHMSVRSNQDLCSYEMVRLVQFSRFWLALLSEVTYIGKLQVLSNAVLSLQKLTCLYRKVIVGQ